MMKKTDKKQRRRTSPLPQSARPVICPPDRAGMSLGVRIGGTICRMLTIFFAVFGLTLFVCDALRLEQQEITVSAGFLALLSLGFVTVYSAMALSGVGCLCGGVLLVGGAAATVILSGDAAQLPTRVALTAKNVVLTRLYNLGYYGMSRYIDEVGYPAGRGQEYYFKLAVVLLVAVIALVFTLSCIKRVRIAGPVAVSALIIGAVFTYNLSRTNWGVVLVIASFLGLIVMYTYDRLFSEQPDAAHFDCETVLFPPEERPTLPEGELTPEAARQARRQARRRAREDARRHKKEGTQQTVAEELDSYFATSVKAGRRKSDDTRSADRRMTPEQRREQRERRRRVRAVASYDRAVRTSRSAQGGFAAAGAFVLAMLLLLMPALTVTGSFNTIESIDKKMEYYREYVTALLMGNDPILDELGYENDRNYSSPRSTVATPRYYTGKRLMTVETQLAADVYLRGWIGTSYSNGSWNAVSDDSLEEYRSNFGTTLDADELMFNYFYSIMDSSVVESKDFSTNNVSKLKYGFVGMQVNIDRVETGDRLVYMPALYRVDDTVKAIRADSRGVYAYGTSEVLKDTTLVNYFDGIYTGRKFMSELAYASVAYVTQMKRSDWYENVAALIAEYEQGYAEAYDYIGKYAQRVERGQRATFDESIAHMFTEDCDGFVSADPGSEENTVDIVMDYTRGRVRYTYSTVTGEMLDYKVIQLTEFTSVDPETGETTTYTLAFSPSGIDLCTRFRYVMTVEQKRELAYSYYWQYLYESFAYHTYLDNEEDDISSTVRATLSTIVEDYDAQHAESLGYGLLDKAAQQRSSDAEVYEARHKLVMAIVDYLQENYTYTLTPTLPTDESLDGVDNFLAVTKEGYCTQYASALALMLRAAGIPARYVEGYVACDFNRSYSPDAVAKYVTTVRDYNAHSWVEVWYDGVGWVQYEATPVYYDDMYVMQSGSSGTIRPWYAEDDDDSSELELLIDSVSGSLSTAEGLVETLRDELGRLIGGGSIRSDLDSVAETLTDNSAALERCREEYLAHAEDEDWDESGLIERVNVIGKTVDDTLLSQLSLISERIDALADVHTAVLVALLIAAAVALLVVAVVLLDRRARAAERKRMQLLSAVEAGEDDVAGRRETAHSIIDQTTALLAAYGSTPRPGEFREDYARRLESEYIGIFGRLVHVDAADGQQITQLVSDTDMVHLLEAMAAEEFGSGMTDGELRELATFCRRLREAVKLRLPWHKRLYYHFIKRII